MCVYRFKTALQSERAIAKPCIHLNNNTLLSISKMTVQLAKDLQISLGHDQVTIHSMDTIQDAQNLDKSTYSNNNILTNTELRRRHTSSALSSGYQIPASSISSSTTDNIESNIYLLPKRKKNICERLYEFFWSY